MMQLGLKLMIIRRSINNEDKEEMKNVACPTNNPDQNWKVFRHKFHKTQKNDKC